MIFSQLSDALSGNDDYITAMSLHGKGVWLGTRNGYLFLLDSAAVEEGRDSCHLGLQHCGEGKIKNIVPLVSSRHISAKLEVTHRHTHTHTHTHTHRHARTHTHMHARAHTHTHTQTRTHTHTHARARTHTPLQVLCSLEYPDEVSGSVMMWSYQCQQQWRPKPSPSRSQSAPLPPLSASS